MLWGFGHSNARGRYPSRPVPGPFRHRTVDRSWPPGRTCGRGDRTSRPARAISGRRTPQVTSPDATGREVAADHRVWQVVKGRVQAGRLLPDRIPHDLRWTVVRNLVRAGIPRCRDEAYRPQEALGLRAVQQREPWGSPCRWQAIERPLCSNGAHRTGATQVAVTDVLLALVPRVLRRETSRRP
jgi:hypothetical protein